MYSEKRIINTLERLEKNWNSKYWIFAADGQLYLMKCSKDKQRLIAPDGGMSQEAIVEYFSIPSDGGDW